MKKTLAILAASAFAFAAAVPAAHANGGPPSCNWGQLTAEAIAGGFEQGPHSSSFAGSPRAGLANVVNQGDLNATCEFIAAQPVSR